MRNFATAAPEGVKRNSGSSTKLPTIVITVSPAAIFFPVSSFLEVSLNYFSGRITFVRSTASFRFNWRSNSFTAAGSQCISTTA